MRRYWAWPRHLLPNRNLRFYVMQVSASGYNGLYVDAGYVYEKA